MSKLIGICGLKGSGKDTIAKMLPIEWNKMAFADTLKDITATLFGWDRWMLEGSTEESRKWREETSTFWSKELGIENFSPRLALQMLGTNVFRDCFNKDIWVKVLKNKIINTTSNVVVTDVRFPNEVNMIKSLGGKIVQVIRGELPSWWESAEKYNKGDLSLINEINGVHPSEYSLAGILKPDYIIHNDSDMDSLHKKVNEMMDKLFF